MAASVGGIGGVRPGGVRALAARDAALVRAGAAVPALAAAAAELCANAADARAAAVRVTLEGATWVRVEDDGEGIGEGDFGLLATAGATSKGRGSARGAAASLASAPTAALRDARGARVRGHRGEALWALASMSLLEIESRRRGARTTWRKVVKGGRTLSLAQAPRGRAAGTAVTVRDLFCNTPVRALAARRRERQEVDAARDAVALAALAHPNVSFTVVDSTRGGRIVLRTRAGAPASSTAAACLGAVAAGMVECSAASATVRIHGLVSPLSGGSSSRTAQHVFVNGRHVGDSAVGATVLSMWERARATLAPPPRSDRRAPPVTHAAFVLHVECDPDAVALSSELERASASFAQEEDVVAAVRGAVQRAWHDHLPERHMWASSSGKAQMPEHARHVRAPSPTPAPTPQALQKQTRVPSRPSVAALRPPKRPKLGNARQPSIADSSTVTTDSARAGASSIGAGGSFTLDKWRQRKGLGASEVQQTKHPSGMSSAQAAIDEVLGRARCHTAAASGGGLLLPSAPSERVMDTFDVCEGAAPGSIDRTALAGASALAQVGRKFILAVSFTPSGALLLAADQHAVDERIRVEALRADTVRTSGPGAGVLPASNATQTEALARPLPVTLSVSQRSTLDEHAAAVRAWGWHWRDAPTPQYCAGAEESDLLFWAFPLVLGELLTASDLCEWLGVLNATGGATTTPPPAVVRLLASRACRSAVMFGDALTLGDSQRLLDALAGTKLCFQCAHGRPTLAPLADLGALAAAGVARNACEARPRATLHRARERLSRC